MMKKNNKIFKQKLFERRRQKNAPSSSIFVNIRKYSKIFLHLQTSSYIFANIRDSEAEYLRIFTRITVDASTSVQNIIWTWIGFFRCFLLHSVSWKVNFFQNFSPLLKSIFWQKIQGKFFDKVPMISWLVICENLPKKLCDYPQQYPRAHNFKIRHLWSRSNIV